MRPKTDTHDREIKVNQAIRFFKKGHKVQFTMVFRGRERFRREVALEVFRLILAEFEQRVKVERPPSMDGRHMIMILSALKDAFAGVDTGDESKAEALHDESLDEPARDEDIASTESEETAEPQVTPAEGEKQ